MRDGRLFFRRHFSATSQAAWRPLRRRAELCQGCIPVAGAPAAGTEAAVGHGRVPGRGSAPAPPRFALLPLHLTQLHLHHQRPLKHHAPRACHRRQSGSELTTLRQLPGLGPGRGSRQASRLRRRQRHLHWRNSQQQQGVGQCRRDEVVSRDARRPRHLPHSGLPHSCGPRWRWCLPLAAVVASLVAVGAAGLRWCAAFEAS